MSVTNQSRTRRLYLNTNDAIKPPIVDGTSIVTDTQHEAYTARILNACDAKFNLATATLLKKPNERIGISLIKANFSADMALYANYSDDNPNIIFIFSEAPTTITDGNQIGVNLTTEIFNDNNSNMSYPFTYKRGMLNFIDAVNTQIENSRTDSESFLQVSEYSNILFQNSQVIPGLSVKVDNRCWNDPSFKGYHKSNKQIAADLGINTDTNDIYTELNNDSLKSIISINEIFGFPHSVPVLGNYEFTQFLYQATPSGLLVSSVGTVASGYGIYRRDAVFDGFAHTILIFASATGNPAPEAYSFNFMIADFIDNPNFDFTGWDPMTTNPFVEYSGAFAFGDTRTFPNSTLIAPTEGLNNISLSESMYGMNRAENQRFPIGINPSPLYIKTNKSLNSFTTMDSGMRSILAMCPIKAANKSVVYPVIQTTVIPDAPVLAIEEEEVKK
tara:strand:+ start:12 stop:1346 length:1335 start_codon:yes stop_codon:yes gene_type:complete